jgi:hypothetical protein
MSHSKSLRSYADAKEIFDRALVEGGVSVTCQSAGQAVNLRARLNHFRTLDRNSMAEIFPANDPRHGISAYDPFVIRLVNNTLTVEPRELGGYTIEPLTKGPVL